MAQENEQYQQHGFTLGKPLDQNEKELMLKKVHSSLKHVFDIMGMVNQLVEGETEEDRLKRVFVFTSKISAFIVEHLETSGACVVMDKNHAQAIITEMVIPMPALIEGFGTDVLKDM